MRRVVFVLSCPILLGTVFATGLLLGWSDLLPNPLTGQPAGMTRSMQPFWETWGLVEQYYVDRSAVQSQRMIQGAILGMLDTLGDIDHTTYLPPEEAKRMDDHIAGQMEGIGVRVSMRRGRAMVMSVLHGSPAHKSGIRPGDVLLQVDGHDLKDRTLDEVIDLVVGPAGTSLRLSVGREGQAEPLDLRLTRERIEVPDVTWHMLPGHPVAHIAIGSFGEKVHDQLKEALAGARQQGARGLILDVRGNTGGLKDMAVAVTSEFLANGTVYIEQDADGRREPVAVTPGGTATDLPLVLLLDEGTASSAEILAGAVQDQGRAKLVGTRTFGTGTVLQPFELSDGSVVLLAVAQWLTPKGRQIWHQGITPDIVVTLPNEASIILPEEANGLDAAALAKSEDRQLLKALEVLKLELR